MMKVGGIKKIVLFLFAIIIAFLSGACLGHSNGIKQANSWLTAAPNYDSAVVGDLKNEIINLRYLRTGQINASIDRLEFLADNDISYLGIRLIDAKHIPWQKERIIEVLKEAKKYREQYPNYKPKFKTAVENAFKEISGG